MRLAALLHDAPEYVIGDMISPFKAVIGGDYKAIEARLLAAIHRRFGLLAPAARETLALIKSADQAAAYFEATRLAGFSTAEAQKLFGRPKIALPALDDYLEPARPGKAQPNLLSPLRRTRRESLPPPRPARNTAFRSIPPPPAALFRRSRASTCARSTASARWSRKPARARW